MPWQLKLVLRIFVLLLPGYVYVGWRLSNALAELLPVNIFYLRWMIAAVFLSFNGLPFLVISAWWNRSIRSFYMLQPRFDKRDLVFTYPFWIGVITLLEFLPYSLALDILNIMNRHAAIFSGSLLPGVVQVGLFIGFFLYVSFRAYRDTTRIRKKTYTVEISNMKPGLDEFNLTFLSDIQVDRYSGMSKLSQVTDVLQEADGEVVLFGGDLVTDGESYIEQAHHILNHVSNNTPRIACLGDHDFWANSGKIVHGFRKAGWIVLQNEHFIAFHNSHRILISGITHTYHSRMRNTDLRRFLQSAPEAALKILLIHQPSQEVITAAADYHYHLLLAGHTHGGQIVLRPFGFPINIARLEHGFYKGYYHHKNLHVIVTNGIGLSVVPLRYQAPAEIVRIRIKATTGNGTSAING